MMVYSLEGVQVYGISVGLDVARSTMQGNAKASKRGTATGRFHAFIIPMRFMAMNQKLNIIFS